MRRWCAVALGTALAAGIGLAGITPAAAATGGTIRAVPSAPERFTLTRTIFSSPDCTTGGGTPQVIANLSSPSGSVTGTLTLGGSVRLTASAMANSGAPFTGWTSGAPASELVSTSSVAVSGDTICVAVPPASTARTYVATFASDLAPMVVATWPLDGDVDIPVDTDLVVEFDEPVTVVDPGWLDVECEESGVHTGTTTGAGTVFTFDPDTDFAPFEYCVARVVASAVSDVDTIDPPDHPAQDAEFSFDTVADRDTLPPYLVVAHTAGGDNGWDRTASVAVSVTASDEHGLRALACTVDGLPAALSPTFAGGPHYEGSVEVAGEGVHAVVCTATDTAGHTAPGPDLVEAVAIDSVAPSTTVTGVADGAVRTAGVDPAPVTGCATTDDPPGSGVATPAAATTVAALNGNGVGPVTVTCAGAIDVAGNAGLPASVTFSFVYGLGDIVDPAPSTSVKLTPRGRSVVVGFGLDGDPATGFATAGWVVERKAVSCSAPYAGPDAGRTTVALDRQGLRYDASTDAYVAHADFKDVAGGACWRVRVVLDNGQATAWSGAFRVAGK